MRAPANWLPSRSLSALVRISAAAALAAACSRSLGLDRKLTWALPAASRGAMPLTAQSGSTTSSSPSCSTSCRNGIAMVQHRLLVQHLVGDVDARADVDSFLEHDVIFFLLGDLLDHAVGAFQHCCQFFIAALVQVFAKLALAALKILVEVAQLALAAAAVG